MSKANDPRKVTVYYNSEMGMGINRVMGYLVGHGTQKYAQYNNAPYVDFIPKGKRTARRVLKTYRPYLLVLKGWETPAPGDMWRLVSKTDDATVSQSKYSAFDERWETDFDSQVEKADCKVIADYRHTNGFRSV